jgi:O-antigen/teichoic acid export membrane protein
MKFLGGEVDPAGVASAAIRGGTLASKFVLVLALARFYSPEDLGLYGLMVSAVAIATFVIGLEYHYFTTRALIGRPPAQQAALMRDQAVLHALELSVVVPLLAILVSTGVWLPVPRTLFMWFAALLVVELASQEAYSALIALSRPLVANLVLFVRSGIWTVPVVALAVIGTRAIDFVFLAWFCGSVGSLAIAGWRLRGLGWRAAFGRPVDWAAVRFGVKTAAPFVVTTGASMGLLFLDRFIIAANLGLGPVGVYVFFAGIATALHTLVNTGVSLIRVPRLVRAYQDANEPRFLRELHAMARLTITSAIVVAAAAALAIVPLLGLVGRSVYVENLGTFFLLLVAAFIRCLADVPLYGLYAKHRDVSLLALNVTAFVVAAGANIMLVPQFGLVGAAVAAVAGALTLVVAALVATVRTDGDLRSLRRDENPPPRPAL